MLLVEDLHFTYGIKTLLDGVTFKADPEEIVALIGVSGSGKTTLFRLITGLICATSGKVVIGGCTSAERIQMTTYMRQEDLLLPWRTVIGNLMLFSELGKKELPPSELKERASYLLEQVGLSGYENIYPEALSGGMRQRVGLARALLQNRPLMLLDEPFASLDVIIREQLYALLRSIRDQYQKTMVMVTHDFRDAVALADRILILSNGKIAATYLLDPDLRSDPLYSEKLICQIREDLFSLSTL